MNKQHQKRRRAFTMIEVGVALFIISICVAGFTQLIFIVSENEHSLRSRLVAQDQFWNVLEMLPTHCESDQAPTPTDAMRQLVENALPEARLEFQKVPFDESGAPAVENAILVKGIVSWNDGENRSRKQVSFLKLLYVEKPKEEKPTEESSVDPQ